LRAERFIQHEQLNATSNFIVCHRYRSRRIIENPHELVYIIRIKYAEDGLAIRRPHVCNRHALTFE